MNTEHTLEVAREKLKSITDEECDKVTLNIYQVVCNLVDVCERQREQIRALEIRHALLDKASLKPASPDKDPTDEQAGDAFVALFRWLTK